MLTDDGTQFTSKMFRIDVHLHCQEMIDNNHVSPRYQRASEALKQNNCDTSLQLFCWELLWLGYMCPSIQICLHLTCTSANQHNILQYCSATAPPRASVVWEQLSIFIWYILFNRTTSVTSPTACTCYSFTWTGGYNTGITSEQIESESWQMRQQNFCICARTTDVRWQTAFDSPLIQKCCWNSYNDVQKTYAKDNEPFPNIKFIEQSLVLDKNRIHNKTSI